MPVIIHRKSLINKSIIVPTSKSISNRLLILAAIIGPSLKIKDLSEAQDVNDLITALQGLGLVFSRQDHCFNFNQSIRNINFNPDRLIEVYSGNGGTTTRFLIALLSSLVGNFKIVPGDEMKKRPLKELIGPIINLGAEIKILEDGAIHIIRRQVFEYQKQPIVVDGNHSSQFASAIQLGYYPTQINLSCHLSSSETYFEMTNFWIEQVKQHRSLSISVDFSSISYPIVLSLVLRQNITILNAFSLDQYQADSQLFGILEKMGVFFEFNPSLQLNSNKIPLLTSIHWDARKSPDLMMSLIFWASFIDGTSQFDHLEVLEPKETNRLEKIMELLNRVQVSHRLEGKTLYIDGKSSFRPQFFEYFSPEDHRMAMMASLFMMAGDGGILHNENCISKSFPRFIETLN